LRGGYGPTRKRLRRNWRQMPTTANFNLWTKIQEGGGGKKKKKAPVRLTLRAKPKKGGVKGGHWRKKNGGG